MMATRVEVEVKRGWLENRNGLADLTKLVARSVRQAAGEGEVMYIEGIGKRGAYLRGGIMVEVQVFDELAIKWLEARGFNVKGAI